MQNLLFRYGLAAVFFFSIVDANATPILSGVASHHGFFRLSFAIALGTMGCLLGDCFWFWLGRNRADMILRNRVYKHLNKIESVIKRIGAWQILSSHIVYGTRTATMIFWGTQKMSFAKFAAIDSIGCFITTSVLMSFGFFLSTGADTILQRVKNAELLLLAAIVSFAIAFYLLKRTSRRLAT